MALSNGVGAIIRPLNTAAQAAKSATQKAKSQNIQSIKLKFKVKMGGSKKASQPSETESSA